MSKVLELYGRATSEVIDWRSLVAGQHCPFLDRKCQKIRKSDPNITIGTCTVSHGTPPGPVVICPFRLLERSQIFTDCIHLLSLHEPGNELRVISELTVPGGSIDYCVVSVRAGKVIDFVGVELQTLDTTGTVWPQRQKFLREHQIKVRSADAKSTRLFGMNWKMTAKTTLVQLHHKIQTLEHIGKHLVLVLQDALLAYMRRAFAFEHIERVRNGDAMHFHAYALLTERNAFRLRLVDRASTDSAGIARCLGLQGRANVELADILKRIEAKLPTSAPISIAGTTTPPIVGS
jgi:hypothetical protein